MSKYISQNECAPFVFATENEHQPILKQQWSSSSSSIGMAKMGGMLLFAQSVVPNLAVEPPKKDQTFWIAVMDSSYLTSTVYPWHPMSLKQSKVRGIIGIIGKERICQERRDAVWLTTEDCRKSNSPSWTCWASNKHWQDTCANRMPRYRPFWSGLCQLTPIHSCQTCAEMLFILSLQLVHSFLSSLFTVDLNPQKKERKGKANLTVTPRNETFQVPCFKIVWGMPHPNLPSFTNSLSVQHFPFSQSYLSVWWFPSPAHDLQPDGSGVRL